MTSETKSELRVITILSVAIASSFGLGYNFHRAQAERDYYKKTHAVIIGGAHMVGDVFLEKAKRKGDSDFVVSYWVCDTPECKERWQADKITQETIDN